MGLTVASAGCPVSGIVAVTRFVAVSNTEMELLPMLRTYSSPPWKSAAMASARLPTPTSAMIASVRVSMTVRKPGVVSETT